MSEVLATSKLDIPLEPESSISQLTVPLELMTLIDEPAAHELETRDWRMAESTFKLTEPDEPPPVRPEPAVTVTAVMSPPELSSVSQVTVPFEAIVLIDEPAAQVPETRDWMVALL